MRDLLDVVDKTVETPLRAHPGAAPEREATQALVVAEFVNTSIDGRDALAPAGLLAVERLS